MEIKKYNKNIIYRVKAGESKESIASKFNTTVGEIECLTSKSLCEGAFVRIKNKYDFVYVVKPLDDLTKIANKFHVSVEEILKANNLKDKRLFVGQRLHFSGRE